MNDDVCVGTLFSGSMPCYLISEISTQMPVDISTNHDRNVEPLRHCIIDIYPIAIPDEYM